MKRWLLANGVKLDWGSVVLPTQRKVVQDKAPTRVELRKILMYVPTWLNATIMVLATSGIRSGALTGVKL